MTCLVVGKKRYDTKGSEHLASSEQGYPGDFHHLVEGLYRTGKGNFFLCGGGGPLSRYSKQISSNTWSGQTNVIIPLNAKEAYEWMERNGEIGLIDRFFPEHVEEA